MCVFSPVAAQKFVAEGIMSVAGNVHHLSHGLSPCSELCQMFYTPMVVVIDKHLGESTFSSEAPD